MYVFFIIYVQLRQKHFNKTSRIFQFRFLLSSSIVNVEDSESSLKVVRSHDSESVNTQVIRPVCTQCRNTRLGG